jgi:hypothetical protein
MVQAIGSLVHWFWFKTWFKILSPTNHQLLLGNMNNQIWYNEDKSPFYYQPRPLGYIGDTPIYEGDSTWLCCFLEDRESCQEDNDIPF